MSECVCVHVGCVWMLDVCVLRALEFELDLCWLLILHTHTCQGASEMTSDIFPTTSRSFNCVQMFNPNSWHLFSKPPSGLEFSEPTPDVSRNFMKCNFPNGPVTEFGVM